MPKIKHAFQVDEPISTVWAFFGDVPQVVDCMPGVEILEHLGDEVFKGRMRVKVGPMTANFVGEARITDTDDVKHSQSMSAHGADRQGGSRASAQVHYALSATESGTQVEITADISLQGTMARFGRTGIIQDVSSRLTQEFADCIRGKLSAPSVEEAALVQARDVPAIRLFLRSLWASLKRMFR